MIIINQSKEKSSIYEGEDCSFSHEEISGSDHDDLSDILYQKGGREMQINCSKMSNQKL